jgi:hypothetical protein
MKKVILGIVLFLVVVSLFASPAIGTRGSLRNNAPVCATQKAFDAFMQAASANDTYGMAELYTDGLLVFAESGTKVLVIDKAMFRVKVRILNGENAGFAGWTPMEFVQ